MSDILDILYQRCELQAEELERAKSKMEHMSREVFRLMEEKKIDIKTRQRWIFDAINQEVRRNPTYQFPRKQWTHS